LLESEYDRLTELRLHGQLDQADAAIDRLLPILRNHSARWYWQFYLLKVENIQQKDGAAKALVLLKEVPPKSDELGSIRARYKLDVGWAQFKLSEYEQAKKTIQEGIAIAKLTHADERVASLELALAQILQHENDLPQAEAVLRDASARAQVLHNHAQIIYGLDILGLLLMSEFRHEDALPVFEQEISMVRGTNNFSQLSAALDNLAWCRFELGDEDGALSLFNQAIEAARRGSNTHVRQAALGNAGNIYLRRGEYAAARRMWEEALETTKARGDKDFTVWWLDNLARIDIETGNWRRASEYTSQALSLARELKSKDMELYIDVNLGRIAQGLGDFAAAETQFKEIVRTPSQDHTPLLSAHRWLAQLYANQGRDSQADTEFQSALNVIEERRSKFRGDEIKIDFLSSLLEVHASYIDFLMARGKTERALEVAEASRARTLQEKTGGAGAMNLVSANMYRSIARRSGVILLSYWLGPSRSYVWATTPENTTAYLMPPQAQLRRLVLNYRGFIENIRDPLNTDNAAGRDLYEALLAPVAGLLPRSANLIIAPDGALTALNFETLVVPHPKRHYFIEDATISVVPSLNLLVHQRQSFVRSDRMLLIGDPAFSDPLYPRLPYAAREMALVEKRFSPSNLTAFSGASAAPSAYRESAKTPYRYVHFTAHASTNTESPLDSAILLAGPNGASRLTAREVMNQPLNAGLVTISACRGAGAKTYAGEGLVGFMWAFYQAGARNVIAGLWDVSDESTPQLMDSLYARITQGESPAASLRAAKLELMQSGNAYRLPYYWAPFQLYARDFSPIR
jgi:CHAT domain-containing protein/Tfp pilus assembly protein PilF